MNEQQLADLFSEQLDHLLQGREATLPPEAGDLQELLGLGQQLTQTGFQPSAAVQATFLAQLTAWFGAGAAAAGSSAFWELSKLWIISLSVAVTTIGAGVGLSLLTGVVVDTPESDKATRPLATEIPAPTPQLEPAASPGLPALNPGSAKPSQQDGSSTGDTLSPPTTAPPATATVTPSSSLSDTLSLPEPSPTATPAPDSTAENEVEVRPTGAETLGPEGEKEGEGDETEQLDNDDNSSPGPQDGDIDRGHGNDPDGYDEDNPGQSDGLPAESEDRPAQQDQPQTPGSGPGDSGGDGEGRGGGASGRDSGRGDR